MDTALVVEQLRDGSRWSPEQILARPGPIPRTGGLYLCHAQGLPLPFAHAGERGERAAPIYAGICPARSGSKRTLRDRIRGHFSSSAEFSTLRWSLGSVLAEELELEFEPGHFGKRGNALMTFGAGERRLTDWMYANTTWTWVEHAAPWEVERSVIGQMCPSLNLHHNSANPLRSELTRLRKSLVEGLHP